MKWGDTMSYPRISENIERSEASGAGVSPGTLLVFQALAEGLMVALTEG